MKGQTILVLALLAVVVYYLYKLATGAKATAQAAEKAVVQGSTALSNAVLPSDPNSTAAKISPFGYAISTSLDYAAEAYGYLTSASGLGTNS